MSAIRSPVQAVDPHSPADLVDLYWERAYRFAAMITRSNQESADIAQEALLKVLRNLERFDAKHGDFESWLWRIVLNTARDAGRAAGRRQILLDRLRRDGRLELPSDSEALALRRLQDLQLLAAVRHLPKHPRTLIALRFGAGLSYREIGQQMAMSEAAALMATRRALSILRRDIKSKELLG